MLANAIIRKPKGFPTYRSIREREFHFSLVDVPIEEDSIENLWGRIVTGKVGAAFGGKQGMADALAKITKRRY